MQAFVAETSRGDPPRNAPLVLQKDGWDDFGFKTQYHLFYFGPEFEGFLGNVKILRRGQVATVSSLFDVGALVPLSDEFVSLGQSLDYYERLALLPVHLRDAILNFLHDAVREPEHAQSFEDEEGWRTSVTRDLDLDSYLPLARVLLDRDYNALPSIGLKLAFQPAGWTTPLKLDFAAPENAPVSLLPFQPLPPRLPERVAVLTGRNGSGKSTLLARLARVLHASQADRQLAELRTLGAIEPPGIGFSRIITVAYSAFDTFQLPGINEAEKRQIVKDVRSGTGRYIFAGLRDIARELEEQLSGSEKGTSLDSADDPFEIDRQHFTYLKSADQLADEYARSIEQIFAASRAPLLRRVLNTLLADPSFADFADLDVFFAAEHRASFMRWSTGHKIVLHAVAALVSNTQRKSIILLDEPESHLHPPLLAAFMHAVRIILEDQDAFAVIATHSPVVAQETLGRHVSVVNRVGDGVTISAPRIETYGESIGEITNELFGLTADATDYHATLRAMVAAGLDLEAIDQRFDRGLSLQARAFVMSLLAARQG